ncbi:MAG: GTPase Era [Thermodesulfobacteriota bacterium]|nr:GTPase Era [Thermodesulfobacteriota bacterium]
MHKNKEKTEKQYIVPPSRFGFVAVCGRPNVGKSSIVNRIVGTDLAAVTPKAQTTRHRISAIYTVPGVQMVFLDAPGIHKPRNLLNQTMVLAAERAISDADVVLMVTDSVRGAVQKDQEICRLLRGSSKKLVLALNKIDLVRPSAADAFEESLKDSVPFEANVRVSAVTGQGMDVLLKTLTDMMPPGPPMFPEDDISDLPVRFFVGEIIREQLLNVTGQEIPYASAVAVEEFREGAEIIYIRADIHVERDSQKKIVIGRGGEMIKRIGIASRMRLESFLDSKVHLELFVKVSPHWTRDPQKMKEFGYS